MAAAAVFVIGFVLGAVLLVLWKYVMDKRQTLREREKADIHFLNAPQLADIRAICREDTPGWVHFQEFEHVHWLNDQLQEMWKFVDRATSHLVKEVVEPMLDSYKPSGVSSLAFKRFKLGSNAPRIEGVKVQRLVAQQVIVDMDVWVGGGSSIILAIASMGVKMHVQLKDLELRARLRLILQLGEQLPCIDAVVISINKKPRLRIDYKLKAIGGQLSSIPGLAGMIESTVQGAIESTLLWPERIVMPLADAFDASSLEMLYEGSLVITAWKAEGLKNVDMMSKSDPFVILWTHSKHKAVTRTIDNDLNPVWNESFELPVDDIHTAELFIQVEDEDSFGSENLGYAMYPLVELLNKDTVQTVTLTLLPKLNNDRMLGIDHKLGHITLQMVYRDYTPEEKVLVTAAEKARDPKARDCPLAPDAAQRAFATALLSARQRKLALASQAKRSVRFVPQASSGVGACERGVGGRAESRSSEGGGAAAAASGADGTAAAAASATAAAAAAADENGDGDVDSEGADSGSSGYGTLTPKTGIPARVVGAGSTWTTSSRGLRRLVKRSEGEGSGKSLWGPLMGWVGSQKERAGSGKEKAGRKNGGEGGWDLVTDSVVGSVSGRNLKRSLQVSRTLRREEGEGAEGGGEEWEDEGDREEESEDEGSPCLENGGSGEERGDGRGGEEGDEGEEGAGLQPHEGEGVLRHEGLEGAAVADGMATAADEGRADGSEECRERGSEEEERAEGNDGQLGQGVALESSQMQGVAGVAGVVGLVVPARKQQLRSFLLGAMKERRATRDGPRSAGRSIDLTSSFERFRIERNGRPRSAQPSVDFTSSFEKSRNERRNRPRSAQASMDFAFAADAGGGCGEEGDEEEQGRESRVEIGEGEETEGLERPVAEGGTEEGRIAIPVRKIELRNLLLRALKERRDGPSSARLGSDSAAGAAGAAGGGSGRGGEGRGLWRRWDALMESAQTSRSVASGSAAAAAAVAAVDAAAASGDSSVDSPAAARAASSGVSSIVTAVESAGAGVASTVSAVGSAVGSASAGVASAVGNASAGVASTVTAVGSAVGKRSFSGVAKAVDRGRAFGQALTSLADRGLPGKGSSGKGLAGKGLGGKGLAAMGLAATGQIGGGHVRSKTLEDVIRFDENEAEEPRGEIGGQGDKAASCREIEGCGEVCGCEGDGQRGLISECDVRAKSFAGLRDGLSKEEECEGLREGEGGEGRSVEAASSDARSQRSQRSVGVGGEAEERERECEEMRGHASAACADADVGNGERRVECSGAGESREVSRGADCAGARGLVEGDGDLRGEGEGGGEEVGERVREKRGERGECIGERSVESVAARCEENGVVRSEGRDEDEGNGLGRGEGNGEHKGEGEGGGTGDGSIDGTTGRHTAAAERLEEAEQTRSEQMSREQASSECKEEGSSVGEKGQGQGGKAMWRGEENGEKTGGEAEEKRRAGDEEEVSRRGEEEDRRRVGEEEEGRRVGDDPLERGWQHEEEAAEGAAAEDDEGAAGSAPALPALPLNPVGAWGGAWLDAAVLGVGRAAGKVAKRSSGVGSGRLAGDGERREGGGQAALESTQKSPQRGGSRSRRLVGDLEWKEEGGQAGGEAAEAAREERRKEDPLPAAATAVSAAASVLTAHSPKSAAAVAAAATNGAAAGGGRELVKQPAVPIPVRTAAAEGASESIQKSPKPPGIPIPNSIPERTAAAVDLVASARTPSSGSGRIPLSSLPSPRFISKILGATSPSQSKDKVTNPANDPSQLDRQNTEPLSRPAQARRRTKSFEDLDDMVCGDDIRDESGPLDGVDLHVWPKSISRQRSAERSAPDGASRGGLGSGRLGLGGLGYSISERIGMGASSLEGSSPSPNNEGLGGRSLSKGKGKVSWGFAKGVGRALRGMKGGAKCAYSPEELRDRLEDRRAEMEESGEMEG
ncbi:hypothetical protein CLOP_g4622 [Closterium sp. NIES-67]|nr:hypothetical protein CLOP_g4622 [Closterium sp. NIES-67]